MIPRRQRLRKSALHGMPGFIVVVVPSCLLFALLLLAGIDLSLSVALACGLLAVATFAVSQLQTRRPRARRVVFLAKSRSSFAFNIHRGLDEGLEKHGDIQVSRLFPERGEDGTMFQLSKLRSLEVARADGLVIIPSTENEQLWHELVRIVRRGTVVVCVDTKPPNHLFSAHGVARPLFVGSNFTLGGRMVGRFISTRLGEVEGARLLVAVGPETSWPGRERGSWILYELAVAGMLDRCQAIELPSWHAPACADTLHAEIESAAEDGCTELFVFAGNDKVALELHHRLDRAGGPNGLEVHLVGYDGTTTDDGTHVLDGFDRAKATVNAVPYAQGLAAAEFIAWAYEGEHPDFNNRIVDPQLVQLNGCEEDAAAAAARSVLG